jgi:hypothetical protein
MVVINKDTTQGRIAFEGHHPFHIISVDSSPDALWYAHAGVTSTQQLQEREIVPGHHRVIMTDLQLLPYAYAGVVVDLDQLFGFKVRINSFLASIPDPCCKVCYILGERRTSTCGAVCKKFAGVMLCS